MKIKTLALATFMAVATVPATVLADNPTGEKRTEAGQFVSDAAITTKVKAALLAERDLKAMQIHVDTKDGVVHLTGEAESSAQIVRAVDVATGIKGVKDVRNSINLKTHAN